MSRVIRGCDQKLMACLSSETRPPTQPVLALFPVSYKDYTPPVSARWLWCDALDLHRANYPAPPPSFCLLLTPIVCFRRAAALGRSELPGAERPSQDAGQHVRPLRQLQWRQEGRLHRAAWGAALLRPGVRKLLASGRQEGVLRAAQRCAPSPAHLQGRLGGQHPVRQALRRHQEQSVRRVPLRRAATVLLQGVPHRHVRVPRNTVPLRGENINARF